LLNTKEESNRLRIRLAEIFTQRNWTLETEENAASLASHPPVGWTVQGLRLIPQPE